MTLREKLAQLYAVWVGVSPVGGDDVAPFQHELTDGVDFERVIPNGLGQLTRPFGSAPVDPAVGVLSLARMQRRIVEASRFGIPALAHEECLAGFTAWGATAYPVPLSWGASFNPELIEEMAKRIGTSMRSVGIHQGLAPVLDVTRDPRWGRTEETISEDPYLVGTIATAYVRGLEGAGVIATLKHFIGYSASRAARNLAPVSMGPREFADVMALPFEMAIRESSVRSVMSAYTDVDGIPAAANRELLTGLLRETWGFTGTVVGRLLRRHLPAHPAPDRRHRRRGCRGRAQRRLGRRAADRERLQRAAGRRGRGRAHRAGAGQRGPTPRAVGRRSSSGCSIPTGTRCRRASPTLTSTTSSPCAAGSRSTRRPTASSRGAWQSSRWCCSRTTARSRSPQATDQRILVVGPTADDNLTLLGCYSFPGHVGTLYPDIPLGIEIPTMLEAIRAEFPDASITHLLGVAIDGEDDSGIAEAVRAARDSDLVIAMLGDRAGLFGRGTSGEGCDAAAMRLPGRQQELLEALLDSQHPGGDRAGAGPPVLARHRTAASGGDRRLVLPG